MTKSPFARKLDEVIRSISVYLETAGFRKKGRSFNRTLEDGLIHVIGFQMGHFPVGDIDKYVVPGLRENLYGKYTVNLGVHIREVYELDSSASAAISEKLFPNARRKTPSTDPSTHSAPAFCHEYHCEVRARLGELATPPSDTWWPLDPDASSEEMAALLQRAVETWLPLFATRDQVLAIDASHVHLLGWPIRGSMVQAIIWAYRGDRERAQASLRGYWHEYQDRGLSPKHGDYIREIARRLGINLE